jgi:hypothetical protein
VNEFEFLLVECIQYRYNLFVCSFCFVGFLNSDRRWLFMMQGDEIYDAMLNQTNVGDNNNKFYVIQVLG